MSPRPRSVSDQRILAATARMVSRLGPTRLTLADVGGDVGLSPAALVQRFGSKRGLLLALAARSVDEVPERFASVRDDHESPLDALLAAATSVAEHVHAPEELANHLAFFQIDLSDGDFHGLALEHSRRVRSGYRELLDAAVTAGELAPCDTTALAGALQAITSGSLLNWAIHRHGGVARWVRGDIETLLAPYRAATPPAAARRTPRTGNGRPGPRRTGRDR